MGLKLAGGVSLAQPDVDPIADALQVTIGPYADQFVVAGGTAAVVAASLASSTSLVAMRNAVAAGKSCWITKLKVRMTVGTVGTSALVAGLIGWQMTQGATMTGGTARTPRMKRIVNAATGMTDVRDNNAALTPGAVAFGHVVDACHVPLMTVGVQPSEWVTDFFDSPLELIPGDGICLRTQSAMPATQTWQFAWSAQWFEE